MLAALPGATFHSWTEKHPPTGILNLVGNDKLCGIKLFLRAHVEHSQSAFVGTAPR